MTTISFADVVHQQISFSKDIESEAVVLDLIDTPWVQRLRSISQTANTRLVYMFSEHSRFGHSLGVAFLANLLMQKLSPNFKKEVERYKTAVSAAALLHDIGHLAPGSHTSYKTWFPKGKDIHEQVSARIIEEDSHTCAILEKYGKDLPKLVSQILSESSELPPWTWEIISGGGWNVDRGNWCIADSVLAGVSYGRYNIPALIESIVITDDKHLAVRENRLDAIMHFAIARHSMYRQVYQHRVLRAADMVNKSIVERARDLGTSLSFQDKYMQQVLHANSPQDLSLNTIFWMRESWWEYHISRWSEGEDKILADLSGRLLKRRLFKTVRVQETDNLEELRRAAHEAISKSGLDPKYYLHEVSTSDMHADDYRQSMLVLMDDGRIRHLTDAEPLFNAMATESKSGKKTWLVLPKEAKDKMGRTR